MGKFDPLHQNRLSGLVGNLVVSGNTVRRRPRPRSKDSWSENQNKQRLRFSKVIELYHHLKSSIVNPIWKHSAQGGLSAYKLFIRENIQAFDTNGNIKDPLKLKMSIGSLPQPFNLKLEKSPVDIDKLKLSWENDSSISRERGSDILMLVFYKDGCFTGPWRTECKRVDQLAYFAVSAGFEDDGCVFVFFGNRRGDAFCDSWVLGW